MGVTGRVRAAQKGLELVCHIPAEVPECLMGDPGRLAQILINLVGNAIKFTEKGEVVVTVQLMNQETPTWPDAVDLQFTVADTGLGIPAEKQALLFAPFSQADTSTTRRFGGTGLGLAISKQLAALMGGRAFGEQAGNGMFPCGARATAQ